MNITLPNRTGNFSHIKTRYVVAAAGICLAIAAITGVSVIRNGDGTSVAPAASGSQGYFGAWEQVYAGLAAGMPRAVVSSQSSLTAAEAYEAFAASRESSTVGLAEWESLYAGLPEARSVVIGQPAVSSQSPLTTAEAYEALGGAMPLGVPTNSSNALEIARSLDLEAWERLMADESFSGGSAVSPGVAPVTVMDFGAWDFLYAGLPEFASGLPVREPAVSSQSPLTVAETHALLAAQ